MQYVAQPTPEQLQLVCQRCQYVGKKKDLG